MNKSNKTNTHSVYCCPRKPFSVWTELNEILFCRNDIKKLWFHPFIGSIQNKWNNCWSFGFSLSHISDLLFHLSSMLKSFVTVCSTFCSDSGPPFFFLAQLETLNSIFRSGKSDWDHTSLLWELLSSAVTLNFTSIHYHKLQSSVMVICIFHHIMRLGLWKAKENSLYICIFHAKGVLSWPRWSIFQFILENISITIKCSCLCIIFKQMQASK